MGADDVSDALLVDSNTVRNHFNAYRAGGLLGLARLAYRGSECELSKAELNALDAHVQANLYLSTKDLEAWVEAKTDTSGARTASFVTGGAPRPRSGAQTLEPVYRAAGPVAGFVIGPDVQRSTSWDEHSTRNPMKSNLYDGEYLLRLVERADL